MKKLIVLVVFFVFVGSTALLAANGMEKDANDIIKTHFAVNSEISFEEEILECWIMYVSCECGNTWETQYCNEGLHGSPEDWVNTICDQDCGPID